MYSAVQVKALTKYKALCIGNSAYAEIGELPNAVPDTEAISRALGELGYVSQLVLDRTRAQLEKGIRDFVDTIQDGDFVLVSYSGHGAEANNELYILPVDLKKGVKPDSTNATTLKVCVSESKGVSYICLTVDGVACRACPTKSTQSFLRTSSCLWMLAVSLWTALRCVCEDLVMRSRQLREIWRCRKQH
jgi:Caspase domain